MVNDVLTMAYFPFVDNLSYNQLSQWQKEVKAPSEHELNSVNITRLTQSITEKHRMDLFRCRARRVGKGELCAVDSTSMSTYGFKLVDIRWCKNRVGGKRSSFLPTFVFRPLTPPYVRFRIRRFFILRAI